MSLTKEQLAEGERLEAAARAEMERGGKFGSRVEYHNWMFENCEALLAAARERDEARDLANRHYQAMHSIEADRDRLAGEVAGLRERVAELMWALDRYGKHPDDCGDNQGSCTCGLHDVENDRWSPFKAARHKARLATGAEGGRSE